MSGVSFLPEEFCRSEKQTGPHFPSDHIGPLVDEDRKIPVRGDPISVRIPDNCFGSRTNDQLFFQFCIRIDDQTFPIWIIFKPLMVEKGTSFANSFSVS